MMAQIIDFLGVKADILKKFQTLLEARGDQIISVGWQMADEELEGGARIESSLQIACSHGEFVQIS